MAKGYRLDGLYKQIRANIGSVKDQRVLLENSTSYKQIGNELWTYLVITVIQKKGEQKGHIDGWAEKMTNRAEEITLNILQTESLFDAMVNTVMAGKPTFDKNISGYIGKF